MTNSMVLSPLDCMHNFIVFFDYKRGSTDYGFQMCNYIIIVSYSKLTNGDILLYSGRKTRGWISLRPRGLSHGNTNAS